jgi:hypothetical protein
LAHRRAQVAQSVEQWIENPRVGSSILSLGTILPFSVVRVGSGEFKILKKSDDMALNHSSSSAREPGQPPAMMVFLLVSADLLRTRNHPVAYRLCYMQCQA